MSYSKKVISFSLYNSRPKDVVNAIINAMLAPAVYPGWICRFYHDDTVPTFIIDALKKFQHVELIEMPRHKDSSAMCWRFLPSCDPDVAVMISRDADSWISMYEARCVNHWLGTGKRGHIILSHCYHGNATQTMMGGTFGLKAGTVPNMKQMVDDWVAAKETFDQGFLHQKVYPIIEKDCVIHRGKQYDNKHNYLPNGSYASPHALNYPMFEDGNVSELVPGLSFDEYMDLNAPYDGHCQKQHKPFVGAIGERFSPRAQQVLKDFFMKHFGTIPEMIQTLPN